MERVEQIQSIEGDHSTLFSVLISLTFNFRCLTAFHNLRMLIGEVVRKIAQKCEEHMYIES